MGIGFFAARTGRLAAVPREGRPGIRPTRFRVGAGNQTQTKTTNDGGGSARAPLGTFPPSPLPRGLVVWAGYSFERVVSTSPVARSSGQQTHRNDETVATQKPLKRETC